MEEEKLRLLVKGVSEMDLLFLVIILFEKLEVIVFL